VWIVANNLSHQDDRGDARGRKAEHVYLAPLSIDEKLGLSSTFQMDYKLIYGVSSFFIPRLDGI
jgi:hypothetical protein